MLLRSALSLNLQTLEKLGKLISKEEEEGHEKWQSNYSGPGTGQVGAPAAPGQPLPSPRRNLTRRSRSRPPPEAPGTRPEPGEHRLPRTLFGPGGHQPRGPRGLPRARRSSPAPRPPVPGQLGQGSPSPFTLPARPSPTRLPAPPPGPGRAGGPRSRSPRSRSSLRPGRESAVPEGPGLDAAGAPRSPDPARRPSILTGCFHHRAGRGAGEKGRQGGGSGGSAAASRLNARRRRRAEDGGLGAGLGNSPPGARGDGDRSGERAHFSTQPGARPSIPVVRPLRAGPELRSFCRGARPASRFIVSSPPPSPPVGVRARPPRVTQLGAA
ncbi:basic salivary proline-rich protein 1-like [Mustela lutreola]|uniref:basic salivary proline-rich protein 1-like n=1 Tax=Mustela lutreola TaxID=9666 RepID=UPI00279790D7|nr:basic salivary proline-rich protein 1-like [Mustela lutreola]